MKLHAHESWMIKKYAHFLYEKLIRLIQCSNLKPGLNRFDYSNTYFSHICPSCERLMSLCPGWPLLLSLKVFPVPFTLGKPPPPPYLHLRKIKHPSSCSYSWKAALKTLGTVQRALRPSEAAFTLEPGVTCGPAHPELPRRVFRAQLLILWEER